MGGQAEGGDTPLATATMEQIVCCAAIPARAAMHGET
jgi:hypothetical protein